MAVCGASDLKHLDVSYNMIASLPPEVSFFTALTTLDLRYNKLNTVPLEMAVLFAHPNEGKVAPVWTVCAWPRTHFNTHTQLRMMIAGNPMKQVGSASGMWRAGIWRAEDSDMPHAQVSSQQHCSASHRLAHHGSWPASSYRWSSGFWSKLHCACCARRCGRSTAPLPAPVTLQAYVPTLEVRRAMWRLPP